MFDITSTDEELVKAIVHGDETAFKNLYYRYFNLLIRFAWYRLHSMDISRDLVQELFFRLWIKRESLNPNKSIKAYLYKSLNNLIINHIKLISSQFASFDDVDNEKKFSSEINLDVLIDVQNALNKLPEKLKLVYTLSRYDGYKYNEIAEICNISIKAVEKRMSKAFNLLRKVFDSKKYL